MPRLWCFAAENAQDGCLSAYAPAALAEELRFSGDAAALFAALRDVGYLDDACRLVDWEVVCGLAKSRTESAAKAREALAAKRAARSSTRCPNTQEPSRRQERERTERDTVTSAVTDAQQPSLSPPQYCDLTAEQRQELASHIGDETAASDAYCEWRARKLNYGDRFVNAADSFGAALAELKRTYKCARPSVVPISEVPGWYGFLCHRAAKMGRDPSTVPLTWAELPRGEQEVVLGQRAIAALYVDPKQGAE